MTETKTLWKKNIDTRYLAGEDFQTSFQGLKPSMNVIIEKFEDSETFDISKQKTAIKTGFYLKEINGPPLYKPCILNKTNAKFCIKEFGSQYMEDWLNKPFVVYAAPDSRFGFVVRFKKYYPPVISPANAIAALSKSTTLEELQAAWTALTAEEKLLKPVMDKKEDLKVKLTVKTDPK
jgi:hypothetical protein